MTTAKKIATDDLLKVIHLTASESTTHGLDRIFKRQNPFIKIFWLMCFMASAGACFFMIAMSITSYFNFDTATRAQKVFVSSTEFPAVTVCNLNGFSSNKSIEFIKKILVDNNIINNSNESSMNSIYDDELLFYRYMASANVLDPKFSDEFRKSLGYELKDMLITCLFNLTPCSVDDFFWFYDVIFGNCYVFNGGKFANGSQAPLKMSTKPGSINGLRLEIFVPEPSSIFSLATISGVGIRVNNQSTYPSFTEGQMISAGSHSNIEIQRTVTSHLESPYSGCTLKIDEQYSSDLVKAIHKYGYAYSQQSCFLLCYQKYLIQTCQCYDNNVLVPIFSFLNVTGLRPCLNITDIVCDSIAYREFFSKDVQTICGDDCPLECSSVYYTLYTSYGRYPTQAYARSLAGHPLIRTKYGDLNASGKITYEQIERSMVSLSVYFGDLSYQKFEEMVKSNLVDLVSSIGGTLGLFLGMSFLSFVEIIDVCLQICILKFPVWANRAGISPI